MNPHILRKFVNLPVINLPNSVCTVLVPFRCAEHVQLPPGHPDELLWGADLFETFWIDQVVSVRGLQVLTFLDFSDKYWWKWMWWNELTYYLTLMKVDRHLKLDELFRKGASPRLNIGLCHRLLADAAPGELRTWHLTTRLARKWS